MIALLCGIGGALLGLAGGWLLGRQAKRPIEATAAPTPAPSPAKLDHGADLAVRRAALAAAAQGQASAASHLLRQAITARSASRDSWLMLLDIQHRAGQREQFDRLAQEFTSTFAETLPDFTAWTRTFEPARELAQAVPEIFSGRTEGDYPREALDGLMREVGRIGRPAFTVPQVLALQRLLEQRAQARPPHEAGAGVGAGVAQVADRPPSPAAQAAPDDPHASTLERHYARLVNRLTDEWPHAGRASRFLESLIIDEQGGRQGFRPAAMEEILFLQELLAVRDPLDKDAWDAMLGR